MEPFYTKSEKVQQIIKGLNLTKTLYVSSIIIGQPHIGKKRLLTYLFPDTPVVSGTDQEAVESMMAASDELIITDFEKLPNKESLDFDNKRIIATANYIGNQQTIDALFAFIYMMPSLKERPKDVLFLKKAFLEEACNILMIDTSQFTVAQLPTDLTDNSKTLKRSIFYYLISQTLEKAEIQEAIYNYLLQHLEGNNGYKEYLDLYEVPLIRSGLKKYRSQLKLSQILGINRNTLRKKIHEHAID